MSLWREWYLRIEYLPLIGYLHFVAQDDSGVAVKEEDWPLKMRENIDRLGIDGMSGDFSE